MTEPPRWDSPAPPPHQQPQMPPQGWGPQGWTQPPKPGIVPLRPLGVGEILDGAFTYIRTAPAATLGLSAIVVTVIGLIQLPISIYAVGPLLAVTRAGPTAPNLDDLVDTATGSMAGAGLSAVLGFLGTTILTGMLIVVLSQSVLGRTTSIGEAWTSARPRLLGLLGLSVLQVLAMLAVLVVAAAPAVLVGIAGGGGIAVVLLTLLGMLVAACALVFLWTAWLLAPPAYVLERDSVIDAFRRSRRLVAPQFWRILGVGLLAAVLGFLVSAILSVPFSLLSNAFTGAFTDPTAPIDSAGLTTALVISTIGGIVSGTVTSPFLAGVHGLLYVDQRMRREGLDITLQRTVGR